MNTSIIRPVITEKSMMLAQQGKFTFIVERSAGKDSIKQAVESKFQVHVVDVATAIIKGKSKRAGARRTEIKVSPMKKAIVKLQTGEKIGLFELGGEA